ncbi:unnamed protein product [Brachionus calyciflorus]|uniref:Uncharacterized protein n=1 Tax=Brachionus calyciflorus TaxID=104777 RepID=A0A814EMP0_9BILA|nr:unnamed protein product [Brachionus calyciflorus]
MNNLDWKWTKIDACLFNDVLVPIIKRKDGHYWICARIVNSLILDSFENNLSQEAKDYGSLVGLLCNQDEVKLLNAINLTFKNLFGHEEFNQYDMMVRFDKFLEFYQIVKTTIRLRTTTTTNTITHSNQVNQNDAIQNQ